MHCKRTSALDYKRVLQTRNLNPYRCQQMTRFDMTKTNRAMNSSIQQLLFFGAHYFEFSDETTKIGHKLRQQLADRITAVYCCRESTLPTCTADWVVGG
jgi:hypothetical protein